MCRCLNNKSIDPFRSYLENFQDLLEDHLNFDDVHFDEEPQFFGGDIENQVATYWDPFRSEILLDPT